MTYLNKPHLATLSIASVLLLSACGGGGGSSSGGSTTPPPPPPPVADTTSPSVSFSPATLSVASEMTGVSTVSASDANGISSGPDVTCTNGGSFDVGTNIFTAPAVTANTTSVCTAVATDPAGNQGSATLTVTVTPPVQADSQAPVLSFSPDTVSLDVGRTIATTLTATDNIEITSGPTVTCTNGGTFDVTRNRFRSANVTVETISVCTATATDAAGNTGTATLTATMIPLPSSGVGMLSGTLTYDRVPISASSLGLNYNATTQMPIRQAPVDLVNAAGTVIDTTVSDDNGDYSFADVDAGENVRVRVRSEVQKPAPNEVDLQVVDNTSNDAVYALQGPLSVMPASNQTRDLNADSGWGGSSYTSTRAAAPFALLDTIYGTIEEFVAIDPDVDFPPFDVQWSTLNVPQGGNVDIGQIGTSSFTQENRGAQGIVPVIRILGTANNDTDEYDVHVVVHEFGHYFENNLSRADSVGGPHSSNDRLDSRTAFGEGWGNALSGMILDDPLYRDSSGSRQSTGFSIDVENNVYPGSTGWFSEGSVQSILYDLFDTRNDGADSAAFGLGPIYGAFVDPDYRDTEAFTTIFAFLNALDNQPGVNAAQVQAITDAQLISGTGQFGVGETNNGGLTNSAGMTGALPVYLNLPTNNSPVDFCSVDNFGDFNKHGNRRFFEFTAPSAGNYRIRIARTSGRNDTDPDVLIFNRGTLVATGESGAANSEDTTFTLAAGQHVASAFDFNNIGELLGAPVTSGDACFTIRLEAL